MANIIQLKRSSVAGKIPAAANVSVGEPVVNLTDRVLYTKDGGGNVIQIAAGNLQGLADVSNASPNVNDVIVWTGTEWKPSLNFGNITSVNGEVGEVVLSTANIAESGNINLYFSNIRARNAFTAGESINIDSNGLISSNVSGGAGSNLQTSNISELADVSDNVANTGQVLIWSGTEWEPNTITQNVTTNITLSNTFSNTFYSGANVLSGTLESVEFTANGSGNTYGLDFTPGKAESVFVFVDGIVQTANVHYTVDGNVLTLLGTPDSNAEVSIRYYDPVPAIKTILGSLIEDTFTANGSGSTYILSKNVISNDSVMVFVNGVIQEGSNNYSVSGNILTFTSNPDNDANIFVRYFDTTGTSIAFGNIALNTTITPVDGQALVWNTSNASWEPGTVVTSEWNEVTSNITAQVSYKYIVNTSANPITITLPSSPTLGDEVYFLDGSGTFSANNLTLARNGSNIMGLEDDLINNVDDAYFGIVYYNTLNGWRILS